MCPRRDSARSTDSSAPPAPPPMRTRPTLRVPVRQTQTTRAGPGLTRYRRRRDWNTVSLFLRGGVVDRVSLVARPVLERTVVQKHRMPERPRCEKHRSSLLADMAVTDDCVVRLHARFGEQRREIGRRANEVLVIDELCERKAVRPGDVSGLLVVPVAALLGAVVEDSVAAVDDRDARRAELALHVIAIDDDRLDFQR